MKFHTVILAAVAAAPLVAAAQEPERLETIVVTPTRSTQTGTRLPASVRVISAADIAASGARTLADVLRSAGSLQITDFYGDSSRAQVDARGFGDAANANTLVLVDGRRLNNPDIATPDLSSIALKDIERIEIIEGSAGALYGDQATGGVINIITRTKERATLRAEALAGSYDAFGGRAALAHGQGGGSLRLSAEHRGSDNYRDHNQVEYRNYLGRAGYAWSGGQLFVEGGSVEEDLETPGALFDTEVQQDRRQARPNFRGDFSDTDTHLQRLGVEHALGRWTLALDQAHRQSEGRFRLSSQFGAATQDSSQSRELRAWNPKLTASLPLFGRDVDLTLGGDFQHAHYALRSPFGTQLNEQRQSDAYAQAIVPLPGAVDLTLGGRAAHVRNRVVDGITFTQPTTFTDDETAAQLGLSWALGGWRLFSRADRGFRYAKVDEFTFTSAGFGSNQNLLGTQSGVTLELGAEWSYDCLRLGASAFRIDTDDEIAFDPLGGPFGFGANINLPATRRDGTAFHARWALVEWLTFAVDGQYLDAQVTDGALKDRDIPLVASRIGQASTTAQLPLGISAQAGVSYTGQRAYAGDFDNSLGLVPSHSVVHLALAWGWRALDLSLRVNNLLDREYAEYGASGLDNTFTERPAFQPSPELNLALTARVEL